MDNFAHERAEYPSLQGVNGSLERYTEDDEEEVSHAQVEYEEVGGVVPHLATPQQHSQHQAVSNGAEQEYEGEDNRDDHTGGVQLVALRYISLASWPAEILKV